MLLLLLKGRSKGRFGGSLLGGGAGEGKQVGHWTTGSSSSLL
jgi:hypothetical protein